MREKEKTRERMCCLLFVVGPLCLSLSPLFFEERFIFFFSISFSFVFSLQLDLFRRRRRRLFPVRKFPRIFGTPCIRRRQLLFVNGIFPKKVAFFFLLSLILSSICLSFYLSTSRSLALILSVSLSPSFSTQFLVPVISIRQLFSTSPLLAAAGENREIVCCSVCHFFFLSGGLYRTASLISHQKNAHVSLFPVCCTQCTNRHRNL